MKEKDIYKKFVKATPKIIHNRIESLWAGFPDDVIYTNNKKFFTVEFKYTEGSKVRISPFQVSFALRHPIGHFFLIGSKNSVKLFESKQINDLLKDGFKAPNEIANTWEGIRDYFYSL